jgi:hypothetical protein
METSPQTQQATTEIELEELDDGRFRFLARLPGDPHTRFVSSPFTMPRESLDRLSDDGEADLEARVRLGELDTALSSAGWQDDPDRGPHWWSLRYGRG